MNAISEWPRDLRGKIVKPKIAEISVGLRFGLWENYTRWLDASKQKDYWYDVDILKKSDVTVKITLGDMIIFEDTLKEFGLITAHRVFEDMDSGSCDLEIKISNLTRLPIRDDTGVFVCAMINLETIKLQDIEIKNLVESTLFGNDISIIIPIHKPIYSWMMNNWSSILPNQFNQIVGEIDDIKQYNHSILSGGK